MNKSIFSMNSLSKYSDLFQIIGVIGLIASLIFVGIELRQSQEIALIEQRQERVRLLVDIQNNWAANGVDFLEWQENGANDQNREFVIAIKNSLWNIYALDYQLYNRGYRSKSHFLSKLNRGMARNMNGRNLEECMISKRVWGIRQHGVDPNFREIIETLPNTCESLMSEEN